ncbi:hypothetical protein UJ101_01012 [Flavobacteriaceae bacterium UJ101]|nr:hypothetical protein UJ101_01012 [Flavobacteriaceae bacterium UJ101]
MKNKNFQKKGDLNLFCDKNKVKELYLNSIVENTLKKLDYETIEDFKRQYTEERIFELALKNNTTTTTAVCHAFSIEQKNATRYKRNLEEANRLIVLIPRSKRKRCPITGFIASFLTTNTNLINN